MNGWPADEYASNREQRPVNIAPAFITGMQAAKPHVDLVKIRWRKQLCATVGNGPYRSSDVADALGESSQSLGPRRAQIISKGMIYSPSHGDIAFTVPMFNDYLTRNLANLG